MVDSADQKGPVIGPSTYVKLTIQNVILAVTFLLGLAGSSIGLYYHLAQVVDSNRVEAAHSLETAQQAMQALVSANKAASEATDQALNGRVSGLETNDQRAWALAQLHERWLIAIGIKTGINPPDSR